MASSPNFPAPVVAGGAIQPSRVGSTAQCPRTARWTLPGEARLLIHQGSARVSASIGNRHYDGLPDIAIIGPTSKPRALWCAGEPPVEIVLSALDWCRLTGWPADGVADRIVTADQIGLGGLADALSTTLDLSDDDDGDDPHRRAFLARMVIARHDADASLRMVPQIRALMTIVDEARAVDAADVADQMGLAPHALRRLALRHFGFPAKTVLIRRRFLIALAQFEVAGMDMPAAIGCGYFDASHFLRDAKRFLGMTPRRFMTLTGRARPAE